jgi:hypothetical protein
MKTTTLRLRAIRWKPNATADDRCDANDARLALWLEGERFHWSWQTCPIDLPPVKRRRWLVDRRAEKTA